MTFDTSILTKPIEDVFTRNPTTGELISPCCDDLLGLIATLSPRVNETIDKVNALIRGIEDRLRSAGAAVWSSVDVDPLCGVGHRYDFEDHPATDDLRREACEDADPSKLVRLVYDRYGDQWRIGLHEIVFWNDEEEDDDGEYARNETIFNKPLSDCPRHKKLFVVEYLPELLFEIARSFYSLDQMAQESLKSPTLAIATSSSR